MSFSVQQIKFEFFAYIKEFDVEFSNWTICASSNPKEDLTALHHAHLEQDYWIFKPAVSEIAARNIVKYFTQTLTCQPGIESTSTVQKSHVYLFRKSLLKQN